ncbi:MAG: hypothetical protein ACRBCK_06995 [Alphaproteobacteria bacterium]
MNMLLNIFGAEFQRNVWTRFSRFSVLLMPTLIGVGLLLCYLSYLVQYDARMAIRAVQGTEHLFAFDPHWSARSLFLIIPFLFIVLYILGIYEAASAFTSEVRNKTWDMKKVSAITPLHLVLGKLFGVTSYVWYASALLLGVGVYAYSHHFEMTGVGEGAVKNYPSQRDMLLLVSVIIVPAFFGHIVALYGSLLNLRRGRTGSIIVLFVAFFAATHLHTQLADLFQIKHYSDETGFLYGHLSDVTWFGMSFSPSAFALWTLGYVIICICIGTYRLARAELNFKSFPFVYLGFLISICIYFSGFSIEELQAGSDEKLYQNLSIIGFYFPSFLVFTIASFRELLFVSDNISLYQRFLISIRLKNFKRALENVPAWMITLPVSFIVLCVWCVAARDDFEVGAFFLGLSLLFFIVRDGLVQHLLMLGNRSKRGGIKLALYYLFMYLILPSITGFLIKIFVGTEIVWDAVKSDHNWTHYVLGTFYPNFMERWDVALLPASIQIAVLSYMLWKKVQHYRIADV